MINKPNKNNERKIRAARIRKKVSGTPERPRLSVFRSLSNISCQFIDDVNGVTLLSASTLDKSIAKLIEGKTKKEAAFIVGEEAGKLAIKKGITSVVFDRAGYVYTGRVMALADGARKAGLNF